MSTGIEWCDETWNPVTGCTKVSAGCKFCYAEGIAKRLFASTYPQVPVSPLPDHVRTSLESSFPSGTADTLEQAPGMRPRRFTDVQTHADRLALPLTWRKPKRIFVNSMSDLFHEDVPDAFIDQVFAVMALADWHTFIVLTKRPKRMHTYLSTMTFGQSVISEPSAFKRVVAAMDQPSWLPAGRRFLRVPENWPLPNLQLGVSVEDQKTADERIPLLLQTPAAKRIVSYEPALGPVNFTRLPMNRFVPPGHTLHGADDLFNSALKAYPGANYAPLDQIIVGGESGPMARPCHAGWIRSTVRQCKAARVSCFVKQVGAHVIDRNDLLGSDRPAWDEHEWPEPEGGWEFGSRGNVQEDIDGTRDGYQGATVRIRLSDRKGGDPSEWPEELRVREVV